MPDLKEKYSDPELDRSHKAFEEIVNRPDMLALDDQGDAIAREYSDAEKKLGGEPTSGADTTPESIKQSENSTQTARNPFNYQKNTASKTDTKAGWSRKKKFATFGGAGGGIAAMLISGIFLLPLKIPGIMQMISDEAGQRVEQITEKRAKIILGRAIISKFGAGTGVVITGKGPVSTLVASMRTNSFEKKLAAKGLVIKKSGSGVKLIMNGKTLGNGATLNNETQIVKALEADKLSNRLLKDIVKEEIPSWRWMKRAKFAKWLRIKYGIPRYGIENNKEPDEEERVKKMNEERLKTEYGALADDMGKASGCLIEANCNVDPDNQSAVDTPGNQEITDAAKESGEKIAKENAETASKGAVKTMLSDLSTKVASKAIPIIGWVDLAATIDHFAYETSQNDYFGKLAALYRARQYARHYGTWSGYGSQVQLGAMDPAFIGVLAAQTQGIEESQAFNLIEGNPDRGIPPHKINANNTGAISDKLKEAVPIVNAYDGIGGKAAHEVLNLWYKSMSSISEKIGSLIAGITPDKLLEWAAPLTSKMMSVIFNIMGLNFDPASKGAEWFNAAHGGATWSYNDFCQTEMGCRKLSSAQATLQNETIATERAEYIEEKGLLYALFSTESNNSLTTQLAVRAPENTASLVSGFMGIITKTPAIVMSTLSGKASATTYTDIHGVDPYGALEGELDKPVDSKAISGEECSEKPTGTELDLCRTDKLTAEAMLCEFQPESQECSDTDTPKATSATNGTVIRAASFNIYHSDDPIWKERLARSVGVLTDNAVDVAGLQEVRPDQNQLFRDPEYGGSVYDMYPTALKNPDFSPNPIVWKKDKFKLIKTSSIAITYFGGARDNIPVVRLKNTETEQEFYFINTHDPADARGEAAQYRYSNAQKYADTLREMTKEGVPILFSGDFNNAYDVKLGNNNPLGNKRENLTYCIVTDNTDMWDAWDAYNNKEGKCPSTQVKFDDKYSPNPTSPIDHIFVSKDVSIVKFFRAPRGKTKNGSDAHDTIIADAQIGGGGTAGKWAWPVDEKWWKTNRADFLSSHPTYSGTFTSPYTTGVAADIGDPPDGSPVYAMLGGKVIKTNICGAGDGMIIETDTQYGKLTIAYGHGTNPRYKVGDKVNAGEQILNLGAIGCKVKGGHLHVDMSLNNANHICPQDVFLAMDKGNDPDLTALSKKAKSPCGR